MEKTGEERRTVVVGMGKTRIYIGIKEEESPRFQDNRHTMLVRLLALRTDRLYPPGNIPVTHFC